MSAVSWCQIISLHGSTLQLELVRKHVRRHILTRKDRTTIFLFHYEAYLGTSNVCVPGGWTTTFRHQTACALAGEIFKCPVSYTTEFLPIHLLELIYDSGTRCPSLHGVIYLHSQSPRPQNAAALVEQLKSLRTHLVKQFRTSDMCIVKTLPGRSTWRIPVINDCTFQHRQPDPNHGGIRDQPSDIVESIIKPRQSILPDVNITDLTNDYIKMYADWAGVMAE